MFTKAFDLIKDFVQQRNSSGAVALIGFEGTIYGPSAFGALSFFPNAQPMRTDALFDLASLSKVVSTTTVALKLMEENHLHLDDPVQRFYPEAPSDKKSITIQQLLTHTSGLPAVAPLYQRSEFRNKKTALPTVLSVPLVRKPGEAVEYSCVGFITLGLIMEHITGVELDTLFQNYVSHPLGMLDTGYNPPADRLERIPYTEWDPEEKMFLRGMVHDENARGLGGISGNAGLFSTASDLAVFCEMLLHNGQFHGQTILKSETISLLKTNYTAGLNEPRTLGWLLPDPKNCSGGPLLSPHSIGHTGFTGTSIWIDFTRKFYGILLTNRVHPTRNNPAIIPFRPRFYEATCRVIDGTL